MKYIKSKMVKMKSLVCSHPKVKQIWEYGAGTMNPSASIKRVIGIQLIDGAVKYFDDNGGGQAEIDAENYLQNL